MGPGLTVRPTGVRSFAGVLVVMAGLIDSGAEGPGGGGIPIEKNVRVGSPRQTLLLRQKDIG